MTPEDYEKKIESLEEAIALQLKWIELLNKRVHNAHDFAKDIKSALIKAGHLEDKDAFTEEP